MAGRWGQAISRPGVEARPRDIGLLDDGRQERHYCWRLATRVPRAGRQARKGFLALEDYAWALPTRLRRAGRKRRGCGVSGRHQRQMSLSCGRASDSPPASRPEVPELRSWRSTARSGVASAHQKTRTAAAFGAAGRQGGAPALPAGFAERSRKRKAKSGATGPRSVFGLVRDAAIAAPRHANPAFTIPT